MIDNLTKISKNDNFLKNVLPTISEKICDIGAPFEHLVFNDDERLKSMKNQKNESDNIFLSVLPNLEKLTEILSFFLKNNEKNGSSQAENILLQFCFQVLAKLFAISDTKTEILDKLIEKEEKIEKSKIFMVSRFFCFF